AVEKLLAASLRLGQPLLELLHLLLRPFQLLALLGCGRAFELAPRAQLLDARLDVAHRLVGGEQLVEELRRAFASQRRTPGRRIGSSRAQIDHRRESRSASST